MQYYKVIFYVHSNIHGMWSVLIMKEWHPMDF